jgi:hypothetical protein
MVEVTKLLLLLLQPYSKKQLLPQSNKNNNIQLSLFFNAKTMGEYVSP